MTASKSPASFVRSIRKVYGPIGFQKGYNFTLWFVFGGALLGFTLARLQYLAVDTVFAKSAAPGEWYWMRQGRYKIGIALHLGTILPAALLALIQFTPFIRHRLLLLHRINGHITILLLLLSNVGALLIARHSFGGTIETQVLVGVLAIMTTTSAILSFYNIKRLQIEEHRAWMLRTWFYAGSIITLRLIMVLSALLITKATDGNGEGSYWRAMSCEEVYFMLRDGEEQAKALYPQCFSSVNGTLIADIYVPVKAFFPSTDVAQIRSGLTLTFGMAGWLALFIHAAGVEIYLRLTPREHERLRKVSYQRQMEAGLNKPGSTGLTVDRWGDADPWVVPVPELEKGEEVGDGDEERKNGGSPSGRL